MGKIKYDLKDSKKIIGPLYPRLLDKQGREIDGFHREEADSEWPKIQLAHIDTDVKYWIARIVANAHRRTVSKEERKKEVTELAKALRAEGHEGSLVKPISGFTTFSERYIQGLLPKEFKLEKKAVREGMKADELSASTDQKPKKKSKWHTTDEQKLQKLYNKVEKSIFTGQRSLSQAIVDTKSLGLNVESYESEFKKLKACLRNSVGRRYEDVKKSLDEAYTKSTEMKKKLTTQIEFEKKRRQKVIEDLKNEALEEAKSQVVEMTEEERIKNLLKEIPPEFEELKSWAIEGYWGTEAILDLLNKPITLEKIKNILESGDSELIQRVKEGKTSPSHAHTKIKRRQKHLDPPPLPEGIFDVILADPPWPYYLPLRGAPDAHYKTMSIEDICNLEVEGVSIQEKIADDSILFLWSTNPQLKVALGVIESWGFTYKTNLVWVKDKIGTGYYVRGKHELLLIATKGDIPPPVEEVRPSSVLHAPVREHSRKPDEVYDIIETLYPNRRYLELFARNPRENWTSWGLEL